MFKNVLEQYKRRNKVDVDCGNGFVVTVRRASRFNQEFRAKQAQFADGYKDKLPAVAVATDSTNASGFDDPKLDARFFYEVFIVDWQGLKDDDGKTIKPSAKVAEELFSTKEGIFLKELLLTEALKDANFIGDDDAERNKVIAGE